MSLDNAEGLGFRVGFRVSVSRYPLSTVIRLVQVLMKKGVEEHKILFLTLIAAPEGIHRVCGAFPKLKVITSEIDEGIGENFQVIPGEASPALLALPAALLSRQAVPSFHLDAWMYFGLP